MYSGFERTMIRQLATAVPDLAGELVELESRLVDLKAILYKHVYDPDFHGRFGLGDVLPVLMPLPELSYERLSINDGSQASAALCRLLLEGEGLLPEERTRLGGALLAYCELDTLAMVKLTERLRSLAR